MREKPKISVAFYDRLLTYLAIKRLNPIVTELFIRGRTQSISITFTTQYYFAILKNIR